MRFMKRLHKFRCTYSGYGKYIVGKNALSPGDIIFLTEEDMGRYVSFSDIKDGYLEYLGESGILRIEPRFENIIEIDDWIDEKYWPEWRIIFEDGNEIIVKAPNEVQARTKAFRY